MKKMWFLLLFAVVSVITAQYNNLTLENVFQKPPFFKMAALGQWEWLEDFDEYLFF